MNSITNSRRTQPVLPANLGKTEPALATYIQKLHADLYPQVQSLPQNTPAIVNLTNGNVSGANVKQGRNWSVSLEVIPHSSGPSVASGASLTLPFVAANTSVFQVVVNGSILAAIVKGGSSTLVLPNWSSTGTVTIFGKADE